MAYVPIQFPSWCYHPDGSTAVVPNLAALPAGFEFQPAPIHALPKVAPMLTPMAAGTSPVFVRWGGSAHAFHLPEFPVMPTR